MTKEEFIKSINENIDIAVTLKQNLIMLQKEYGKEEFEDLVCELDKDLENLVGELKYVIYRLSYL